MADGVTMRIVNEREVELFFRRLAQSGKDTRPLMATIGDYMWREVIRTFETRGGNIGVRWPALARDTVFTRHGTRRISYGTRPGPKRTWAKLIEYRKAAKIRPGRIGPLPDYRGTRRYKDQLDPPMQSSGQFRDSWKVRGVTRTKARVASTLNDDLVAAIIRRRPVIKIVKRHRKWINDRVRRWIAKNIR